jgi:hypothetical protein
MLLLLIKRIVQNSLRNISPFQGFKILSFTNQGALPLADISHPLGVVLQMSGYRKINESFCIRTLKGSHTPAWDIIPRKFKRN